MDDVLEIVRVLDGWQDIEEIFAEGEEGWSDIGAGMAMLGDGFARPKRRETPRPLGVRFAKPCWCAGARLSRGRVLVVLSVKK